MTDEIKAKIEDELVIPTIPINYAADMFKEFGIAATSDEIYHDYRPELKEDYLDLLGICFYFLDLKVKADALGGHIFAEDDHQVTNMYLNGLRLMRKCVNLD